MINLDFESPAASVIFPISTTKTLESTLKIMLHGSNVTADVKSEGGSGNSSWDESNTTPQLPSGQILKDLQTIFQ